MFYRVPFFLSFAAIWWKIVIYDQHCKYYICDEEYKDGYIQYDPVSHFTPRNLFDHFFTLFQIILDVFIFVINTDYHVSLTTEVFVCIAHNVCCVVTLSNDANQLVIHFIKIASTVDKFGSEVIVESLVIIFTFFQIKLSTIFICFNPIFNFPIFKLSFLIIFLKFR